MTLTTITGDAPEDAGWREISRTETTGQGLYSIPDLPEGERAGWHE
jgi:hypothetical protein